MMYERPFLSYSDIESVWDQVFLYNFFHDSPVDASQWRVVLRGLPSESSCTAPQFDATRHAALCPEVPSCSSLRYKVLCYHLAEIVVCRHHEGPKCPVDCRWIIEGRTDEGMYLSDCLPATFSWLTLDPMGQSQSNPHMQARRGALQLCFTVSTWRMGRTSKGFFFQSAVRPSQGWVWTGQQASCSCSRRRLPSARSSKTHPSWARQN